MEEEEEEGIYRIELKSISRYSLMWKNSSCSAAGKMMTMINDGANHHLNEKHHLPSHPIMYTLTREAPIMATTLYLTVITPYLII